MKKCVWTLCPNGEPVEAEHIEQARELLITDRAVHLDSLAEGLTQIARYRDTIDPAAPAALVVFDRTPPILVVGG